MECVNIISDANNVSSEETKVRARYHNTLSIRLGSLALRGAM
jgi:hypothetical protein